MHWRVGDGQSISIWRDKRIQKPISYTIQSPCLLLPVDAKMELLIGRATGEWNESLIRSIFNEDEAVLIGQIPLSKFRPPNKLIWRATSTGCFTVRSAYHLEKEIQSRKKGEGSMQRGNDHFWKVIWGLEIPNATKVFAWHACNNILPTKDNLKRRRVVQEDICMFCLKEAEIVGHILWKCPSASDM
jgi:hypothetical protein